MKYDCIKCKDGVYYPIKDGSWPGQAYRAYNKFLKGEKITDEEIVMIQWWGNGIVRHEYSQGEIDRLRESMEKRCNNNA